MGDSITLGGNQTFGVKMGTKLFRVDSNLSGGLGVKVIRNGWRCLSGTMP